MPIIRKMTIPMNDFRSLNIERDGSEVEIWLHDSLTRSKKMIASYAGGKYSKIDPEFFRVIKDESCNRKLMHGIKGVFEEPKEEIVKRWTCFKRSIMLRIRRFQRSI